MTLKKVFYSTPYLILEFVFFYVFVPFIADRFLDGWYKVLPLIGIAAVFLIFLLKDPMFDRTILYRMEKWYLKKSVARVIVITVLLVWFTWWVFPQLFLKYPVNNFKNYLVTFFLYPIASVIPQELIYRVYFFHRYEKLVPEKYLLMLSNAIIFGLTHMIYDNWIAPIATFLVSWIFIWNYFQTRSLVNVSLEHYFYGLIMFTIGFGHFFQ